MSLMALSLALIAQAGTPAIDPTVTPGRSLVTPRASAPAGDLCDEPAILIVSGESSALDAFRKSANFSERLGRLGGYELTAAVPSEIAGPSATVQDVLRFPCSANSMIFWRSFAPLPKLSATSYPQVPLPEALVGKVGDDSYSASFDPAGVAQAPAKD